MVPPQFRNVICPWLPQDEIDRAVALCARIWERWPDEREEVFRLSRRREWDPGRSRRKSPPGSRDSR